MFWSNGSDLLRIIIIGPLVYLALILILRVTGKRMLSKMNAFDFVVTIALGSVLATVLMSKDIALAEGVMGLGVLIGLQYVIAWASTRSPRVNRIIKSEPTLLYYQGEFLRDALRQENVAEDALRAGMRSSGCAPWTMWKRWCSSPTAAFPSSSPVRPRGTCSWIHGIGRRRRAAPSPAERDVGLQEHPPASVAVTFPRQRRPSCPRSIAADECHRIYCAIRSRTA
jgi:hypothetical protein